MSNALYLYLYYYLLSRYLSVIWYFFFGEGGMDINNGIMAATMSMGWKGISDIGCLYLGLCS